MLESATAEYVDVILHVAERDASIARVLREICGLDRALRSTALGSAAAMPVSARLRADRGEDVRERLLHRVGGWGICPIDRACSPIAILTPGFRRHGAGRLRM